MQTPYIHNSSKVGQAYKHITKTYPSIVKYLLEGTYKLPSVYGLKMNDCLINNLEYILNVTTFKRKCKRTLLNPCPYCLLMILMNANFSHVILGILFDAFYKYIYIYMCVYIYITLTPWLMEPGGSKPHSQGLSNNSYPEPNQPNYPH